MSVDITRTSHYLHQKYRIRTYPTPKPWVDKDANYNIRSGLLFGESEQKTVELQGWKDKK